ncbi:MAG: hypothetical protein R3C11_18980 [Planctomycetaceae bacterium]
MTCSRTFLFRWFTLLGLVIANFTILFTPQLRSEDEVLKIGDRRELFIDDYLIDSLEGVTQQLNRVQNEGSIFPLDQPWEGRHSGYVTVIRDGDRYLCYYRGSMGGSQGKEVIEQTCLALSDDGIHWTKPVLKLYEFNGSKANNILIGDSLSQTHNFCPFHDTNPKVKPEERFKALGGVKQKSKGLLAFSSPDGIHWKQMQEAPVITYGAFDSQNVPMWSEAEQKYLCYLRIFATNHRRVARSESTDFLSWTKGKMMEYKGAPLEHIYINQTQPYFRAPHIYVATAARLFEKRQVITKEEAEEIDLTPRYISDISDGVLMTSRGGYEYDRTFMEGFIRPAIGPANWTSRNNYPGLGIVKTGDNEMSVYAVQHYGQPDCYIARFSLRLDGFASIKADYDGGTFTTKPFIFEGKVLTLNFATSAAGEIHVEIQDSDGEPIPGFTLAEAEPTIGNEISRTVRWTSGTDVSELAGKPIRLHFKMKDADLYAIKFEK